MSTGWAWTPSLSAVVSVGGLLVMCALGVLLVNIFRPKGYRSATKRAWDHVKWRLQGMPKSGTISVVVTDIEGYSGGWGNHISKCWRAAACAKQAVMRPQQPHNSPQ